MRGSRDSETLLDWVTLARARFARHRTEKPTTKAGQIRALWPDIEAALEGGQSMKSIRKWLEEDAGITLGITSLTSYISRILAVWQPNGAKKLRPTNQYNLKPHRDLMDARQL